MKERYADKVLWATRLGVIVWRVEGGFGDGPSLAASVLGGFLFGQNTRGRLKLKTLWRPVGLYDWLARCRCGDEFFVFTAGNPGCISPARRCAPSRLLYSRRLLLAMGPRRLFGHLFGALEKRGWIVVAAACQLPGRSRRRHAAGRAAPGAIPGFGASARVALGDLWGRGARGRTSALVICLGRAT